VTDPATLQDRARRRLAALTRARRDPRFVRVLGRLVQARVLRTTMDVTKNRDPIDIGEALWVGKTEPRILELLPALIVKRPSLFEDVSKLPVDLAAAVHALRRNEVPDDFRGIPGESLRRWVSSLGHRGKVPSQLRSFRLKASDMNLLECLSAELGVTQTEVLRRGLRHLASIHLLDHHDPDSSEG
jgi:hypothetical protein